MARTYAAVEIDKDAKPKGWNLMRSPSPQVQLIRKLRKKGFYANFGSLRELELHCVRLSKGPDAEGTGRLVDASGQLSLCSKESSSDIKNCQTEQVQSPLAKRVKEADNGARLNQQQSAERDTSPESALGKKFNGKSLVNPSPPYKGSSRNPIIDDWCLTGKDGETVPIMEVPYTGTNLLCTFTSKDAFLSGFVSAEWEGLCTGIEEWKLDLTAEGRLAMYAKTTRKVWTQLGKPQIAYEQTIRSILVYMQLFLMAMEASEVSESMLLQHLENKFHYWRVKPDVSDLHESLLLMKKLNLGATFPIDRLVLSRDMTESGEMVESDADSDSKPLSFKRSRRHTNAELHAEEALGGRYTRSGSMNRSNTSSFDSEYESLTLKSTPRSRKRRLGADKGHHEQCEVLSPNKANTDDVLLSSNLHALKRRKETLQTREDRLADKLQRSDHEPEKHQTSVSYQERDLDTVEVESRAVGKSNTSTVPLHFNKGLENSHSSDQAGGKQNIIEPDDIKSRITKIMSDSSHDTHYGRELGSEHLYLTGPFPAVSKLWALTSAAHRALDGLEKGVSLEEAENICPKESLTEFFANEAALREYGVSQFFPAASKQKEVAERINYYAHDGDTVVEICCQAVDYFSLLKERLANLGKHCNYKRYIMNQSQSHDIKEWMNLEGLPTGSKLLVCLSFSFALWGEQSKKILDYALELKPKLIVLIAPLFSQRLEEYTSYNLVWVDSELLQNEILWPWGLMEVPSTALDKRKGVSPVVFLWSRTDWTTKHRQIASRFGHLQKPVLSGLRG